MAGYGHGQLVVDGLNRIIVYVDGACPRNGQPGARAGLGVYFGPQHMNLSERVVGRQTNNTAEIQAARRAIEVAKTYGFHHLNIHTDSELLYKSVREYFPNWKQNGWRKYNNQPIQNLDDWLPLDQAMKGMEIEWTLVPAHAGIPGNVAADALAVRGANLP